MVIKSTKIHLFSWIPTAPLRSIHPPLKTQAMNLYISIKKDNSVYCLQICALRSLMTRILKQRKYNFCRKINIVWRVYNFSLPLLQALKVYVPSFESYGRMWPHLHTRFLAALVLYQVTMLGYFGVKEFIYTVTLIPLPIISLIFAWVCNKKFYRFFQHPALEVACQELKETPNLKCVYMSFLPPSLSYEMLDVDQCEDV